MELLGYNGKYLIKDNLILFNGKTGVINLAKDVNLTNNSYYNNGGATKQSGFRISHTNNLDISNNAVESNISNTIIYSRDKLSTNVNIVHNYVKGVVTKNNAFVQGINVVSSIFKDPANFDFSIVSSLTQNIGASSAVIEKIKGKIALYNIAVQRIHMDVNKTAQTKYIVDTAPGNIDCSHYNDVNNSYVLVTNIDTNHTIVTNVLTNQFKLYIVDKYTQCIPR